MMKIVNSNRGLFIIAVSGFALVLSSCDTKGPGWEYMPDMYRSPAIEPYVDNEEYGNTDSMSVREPVKGTIPRGFKPYPYQDTPEDYELAGENLTNPLPNTPEILEQGKELYAYMCQHCHGKKGDGKGSITHPVYGAVPSYADATPTRRGNRAMKDLKAGHIYHTIMYGLNAMGPHASQINEEERWKIVRYVQTLQGNDEQPKEEAAETTEEANQSES